MKVPTSMVKPILKTMYPCRRELAPCFIGDPGIGKTQGIYEFAKEVGVNVVTFILSNTVPSEVSGIRMPDKESKKMEVFDDLRMASLKDGDILFFDEILEAPPMLWSACLTLIQDRIMASGRKLPDVFIVAASNKVASPCIIPASTRNRFQMIELEFDPDHWVKWFADKHGIDPTNKVVKAIQGDSDQYNIFTPREAEKLYLWLKEGEQKGPDWQVKRKVIDSMFDDIICDELCKMARSRKSCQRQIFEAINQSNLAFKDDMPIEFLSMSLKSIMEILSSLDEWEDIQQLLAGIEFDEGEFEKEDFESF